MSSNLIGKTLLEQFRVDAFIGSGGMAEVYRVRDLNRNVPLAMKVLRANLAEDPSVFKRFQREANALKKLAHPNIVPFYGLYQTLDFTFLLERFVDGPSLEDVLRDRKTLPLEQTLIYFKALCSALGYAHANGVVHCDVKPGNVLIDHGGSIFLTDFGIARHAESTTTTIASAGTPAYMSAGTPAYMPPEQILGQAVTPAADVYSLGVLLFKMLTGKTPFHGMGAGTEQSGATAKERIRYGHLHLPSPDPREINPAVSEALAKVTQKALNKEPSRRYRSAPEFFEAVCKAAGVSPEAVADRVEPRNLPAKRDSTEDKEPLPGSTPANKFKRLLPWLAVGGMVFLALCVFAGIFLFRLLPSDGSPSSPSGMSNPSVPASVAVSPTLTPPPQPTPTPTGPPPLSLSNYEAFAPLYQWKIDGRVIKITGIAISPDFQKVALLTQRHPEEYGLELRELTDGTLIWEVVLGIKAVYPAIAFSPDASLIATGTDDGDVRLWRVADGSLVQTLSGHNFPVRIVAFSPDGKLVASGGSDQTARVWMVPGGMARQAYENATNVRDIAFSPDSHALAVAGNVVVVWNATTSEREVGRFYDSAGDTQELAEVAFSPDNRLLAASGDWFNVENGRWRKRILVWDFPSGATSPTKIPIDDAVEDLVFSADGQLLLGVYKDRGQLLLIDTRQREIVGQIDIGTKLLMAYSPDVRMFAIVSARTSVTIWGIAL